MPGKRPVHWYTVDGGCLEYPEDWPTASADIADTRAVRGAELVVRAPEEWANRTLWVCFGWPDRFDRGLALALEPQDVYGAPFALWKSTPQGDDDGFQGFMTSYRGIGSVDVALWEGRDPAVSGRRLGTWQLDIGTGGWDETVYRGILDSFNAGDLLHADVTTPLRTHGLPGLAERAKAAQLKGKGSRALEVYYRVAPLLPYLRSAVGRIAQAPSMRAVRDTAFFDLRPDEAGAFFAAHRGALQVAQVVRASRVGAVVVPTAFVATRFSETADIPENRYVRWAARTLGEEILEIVVDELAAYVDRQAVRRERYRKRNPDGAYHGWKGGKRGDVHWQNLDNDVTRHEKALGELRDVVEQVVADAEKLGIAYGVSSGPGMSSESELFDHDARYALVRELRNEIVRSLTLEAVSDETHPLTVAAFSELYERWCFRQVAEALRGEVGFDLVEEGDRLPFYGRPEPDALHARLVHSYHGGLELEIWCGRRYELGHLYGKPKEKGGHYVPYGYENRKNRGWKKGPEDGRKHFPDIALEFRHPSFQGGTLPLIVTLDPTLSKDDNHPGRGLRAKLRYREYLRAFNENDPNNPGTSLPLAAASWAIYPGEDEESDVTNVFDYEAGFLPLSPSSVDALAAHLRRILEQTVYSRLGLSAPR